jgi:hypothetical protein
VTEADEACHDEALLARNEAHLGAVEVDGNGVRVVGIVELCPQHELGAGLDAACDVPVQVLFVVLRKDALIAFSWS